MEFFHTFLLCVVSKSVQQKILVCYSINSLADALQKLNSSSMHALMSLVSGSLCFCFTACLEDTVSWLPINILLMCII